MSTAVYYKGNVYVDYYISNVGTGSNLSNIEITSNITIPKPVLSNQLVQLPRGQLSFTCMFPAYSNVFQE